MLLPSPDPVGVGQEVMLVVWTNHMPPTTPTDYLLGSVGNRAAWTKITATITAPDGTEQTVALPVTDPVGGTFYSFIPDKMGNYSVQVHFPQQWKNTTTYNRLYQAHDSEIATFTVQEEQLQWLPGVPLPTDYWTRPIHGFNREWSQIAGNWITDTRDNPYITTPNTAHVMWTEPYFFGGIAGGAHESLSYYEGTSYEAKFSGVTIMQGILFYNLNLGSSSTGSYQKVIARDLRTGKLIWELNNTSISRSIIYEYDSPNQHGVHPYLVVTSRGVSNVILDPFSGTELFRYTNVPSGTATVGPKGEWQIYVIGGTTANRWLALWDFSKILTLTALTTSGITQFRIDKVETTSYWQWRPVGKVHNGSEPEAYLWNVTLPTGLSGSIQDVLDDRIIGGTFADLTSIPSEDFRMWAVSTKEGQRGRLLWDIKPKPTVANESLHYASASLEEGIVVVTAKETRRFIAYDIDTGEQLWVTEPRSQWMMYSRGATIAYGKVYSAGYGGEIYCYDAKTGDLLWTAAIDNEGLESVYPRSPLSTSVVDGKIFARSSEHSMTNPFYRTWKTYCFNATTGDRIWDLAGTGSGYGFADGYMAYLQYADLQVYCIGKGPSAATVEAKPEVTVYGSSVLVQGMVLDVSAGTKSDALMARFPNGVPAVSDDSMSAWMEHVYMQLPRPTNVSGVEVSIDVLDANGNYRNIGKTTSDANGLYSFDWTPDIEGKYTAIAKFEGSESYWPSHAETAFVVETVAPTPTMQPVNVSQPTEMYIIAGVTAIIIAIAIVGAILFMAIKRRP